MSVLYAGIFAGVLGFAAGWQVNDWRHDAAEAEHARQAKVAEDKQEAKADEAAASHEGVREQIRTEFQVIYRDRDRVVEKPVYRNVCIDADGLRLLRAAVAKPAKASGEPAPTVPGAN